MQGPSAIYRNCGFTGTAKSIYGIGPAHPSADETGGLRGQIARRDPIGDRHVLSVGPPISSTQATMRAQQFWDRFDGTLCRSLTTLHPFPDPLLPPPRTRAWESRQCGDNLRCQPVPWQPRAVLARRSSHDVHGTSSHARMLVRCTLGRQVPGAWPREE
jgi:hypothetical protein